MKIGIPVYDDVDMFDVTGPFEMFDWETSTSRSSHQSLE